MNQLSRVILFSACYILCISAFAQCPDVDAGPDQTSCTIPGVFTLSGSSSSTPIETTWSPITGLSDPTSLTTIATVAVETEYVLTVKSINYDINYVVNGDFMDGNVNFTTDYDFHDNPTFPGNELIEGEYSIGTNPAPMHINWVACGDHTSGDGNMMLVNGDQTANQNAWCQSISVTPNTEYAFSAWVTSVDPNGPCEIQFNINGIPIGDGNVALTTTCVWTQFFVLWDRELPQMQQSVLQT